MQSLALVRPLDRIWPYIQIARVDHWFKNVFMMLGLVVACFAEPQAFNSSSVVPVLVALFATCMVASSNYVLNELLDGATDRMHPEKRHRPVPSGLISPWIGYLEWFVLGILGLWTAAQVNEPFFTSAALLWIMGMLYNIPPIRTKEWPYLDVLSESINNPIRLLLGWFALIADKYPPSSLLLAYWMVGAFFMGTKRLAEYRHIGDHEVAATYRRSFEYYTDQRLLLSVFFYATAAAFFGGIFIVRYHLELILFVPLAAGVLTYYLRISFYPNSPVQHPEKLYREARFMMYLGGSMVIFAVLMFMQIPILYEWFLVEPSTAILWTIGR
jgi:decaprenyl-phosphate phosphoribosyltransferase